MPIDKRGKVVALEALTWHSTMRSAPDPKESAVHDSSEGM
jgi:hypothetical protein